MNINEVLEYRNHMNCIDTNYPFEVVEAKYMFLGSLKLVQVISAEIFNC